MSVLFEPATINHMSLKNRFVRSATYDGAAEQDGRVSDRQVGLYTDLAQGGVGLIVTGIAYVHLSGQLSPVMNSIADDDAIPGLARLARAVHDHGAKTCLQLFHAGREALWVRSRGQLPVAPSVVEDDPFFMGGAHREITEEEIWEVVRSFGDGARRAKEAGFDGVQVHGAHAYLLSQFLSPFANRRRDRWGGCLENRLRIHREVYRSIREAVGDRYPVMIKIGIEDGFRGGLVASEGILAATTLARLGFDALEVSSGLRGERYRGTEFRTGITKPEREAYFAEWCRSVKRQVEVPVMMVGGLRTFELMEGVVRRGDADLVSLSRPLIREPGIIEHWRSDRSWKAKCTSCNKCFEALFRLAPLHCVVEEALKAKALEEKR